MPNQGHKRANYGVGIGAPAGTEFNVEIAAHDSEQVEAGVTLPVLFIMLGDKRKLNESGELTSKYKGWRIRFSFSLTGAD